MDSDLISLELKISMLINFCASLRVENSGLRHELVQSQQNAQALQAKILQASNQLENLLQSIPNNDAFEDVTLQRAKLL